MKSYYSTSSCAYFPIDIYNSRLDVLLEFLYFLAAFAVESCGKSVFSVVCKLKRLIKIGETLYCKYRKEELIVDKLIVMPCFYHRRFNIEAICNSGLDYVPTI